MEMPGHRIDRDGCAGSVPPQKNELPGSHGAQPLLSAELNANPTALVSAHHTKLRDLVDDRAYEVTQDEIRIRRQWVSGRVSSALCISLRD